MIDALYLSATVQTLRLFLFGHSAKMPHEADAMRILAAFLLDDWGGGETTGTSSCNVIQHYTNI